MNSIFHYYAVKLLCLRGGFSEPDSEIIAFSCQLVDRSLVPIKVKTGKDGIYTIPATHHFGFWDKSQAESVWLPFHFFPSGEENPRLRKDRCVDPLVVRPDSQPVKELLIEALKSRNLYRIGIALHCYADSWAHQNYLGKNNSFNKMESFSPIPPAGHAQIGYNPDIWSVDWIDPRLAEGDQICSNNMRFFAAAKKIYKYLATYQRRPFADWELVEWELKDIIIDNAPEKGKKHPRKNAVAGDHQLELEFRLKLECENLTDSLWFSQAIPGIQESGLWKKGNTDNFVVAGHEIRKLLKLQELPPKRAVPDFFHSHIYRWAESAREHLNSALSIMANI